MANESVAAGGEVVDVHSAAHGESVKPGVVAGKHL
jgi:hypothetical protein